MEQFRSRNDQELKRQWEKRRLASRLRYLVNMADLYSKPQSSAPDLNQDQLFQSGNRVIAGTQQKPVIKQP